MIQKILGKIIRAVIVVLYGVEGIGKSTLASQAPDPLFIDLEGGTDIMDVTRVVPPKGWEEFLSMVKEIAASPGICKTLVIDTIDRAEMMAIQHVCQQYKQNGIESFGYGKGYVYLAEEFKHLLNALDLVKAAGINVIILAHAKMRKQELPDETGAFDRWELKLTRQVGPMLKEWCDALLFANYKTYVVSTDTNTKKAQGGKRVIYTSHHPCWDAKNRIGLPEEIPMEYKSIAQLFPNEKPLASPPPYEQFRKMMDEADVAEAEIQRVVAEKGHYSQETPISAYDDKFISGWLIAHWDKIFPIIMNSR